MEKLTSKFEGEKKFSPAQEYVIDLLNNFDGTAIEAELRVSEIQDVEFMRLIASIELPVEISITEGLNGTAKITSGFDQESDSLSGASAIASAGDEQVVHRHKTGRFSFHTHLTNTPEDLAPSPGDMNVNRLRSFNTSTPAVIMNEYGFSVVGVNPFARWFGDEIKKRHTFGEDENMDYLVNRGDWLYNIPAAYAHFFNTVERVHVDIDIKLIFAHKLAQKLGLLIEQHSWDDVHELPEYVLNPTKAEEYWRDKTEALLRDIDSGDIKLSDFNSTDVVSDIVQEMFEYARSVEH